MILVDTSVWVSHFRNDSRTLARLLEQGEVLCHPFIVGELACGRLDPRQEILQRLQSLPEAPLAGHSEAVTFVEHHRLMGLGIGWIDVHLLASAILAGAGLWTLDRPLAHVAGKLAVLVNP